MRYGAANVLADDDTSSLFHSQYTSALFSPDGRAIAASNTDGKVRIWDVRTGQLMRRVKADLDSVICAVFMPDGKGFVSGGWDETLKYWDISSLVAIRFRSSSARNDLRGDGVDKQTQPEREFSGHMVCSLSSLFYFPNHSPFLTLFSRVVPAALPSPLTADGWPLAGSIQMCASGTLEIQQCNVSSTMAKRFTRLNLVRQGLF
jgi:hypothetical protein